MSDIAGAIAQIRAEIKAAQVRSHLAADNILLLAVTKTVSADRINAALDAGITAVGENRVQELLSKYEQVARGVDWHLIGHLQTNKVKYIVDKVSLIHSLDSLELAAEIDKRAAKAGRVMPVLVQVNVADEDSKFGIAPEETLDFIRAASCFDHLRIQGLMTIGPLTADPEGIRPVFRQLRLLKEETAAAGIPGVEMKHLSMGMSGDYPVAVEEGATILRIGSGIFGSRG